MKGKTGRPGPGSRWPAPDLRTLPVSCALGILLVAAATGCRGEPAPLPSIDPAGEAGIVEATPLRSLAIRVTAGGYQWHIRYPGPDGILESPDDILTLRHLYLPASSAISVDLRSDDYTYLFYVPGLRIMEPAIRDMPFTLEFESGEAASYELRGGQMCGFAHEELSGRVEIQTPEAFDAWLAGVSGRAEAGKPDGGAPPAYREAAPRR
jgi:heme/copper-type cytochrome/quinol oxidase subunit 2